MKGGCGLMKEMCANHGAPFSCSPSQRMNSPARKALGVWSFE